MDIFIRIFKKILFQFMYDFISESSLRFVLIKIGVLLQQRPQQYFELIPDNIDTVMIINVIILQSIFQFIIRVNFNKILQIIIVIILIDISDYRLNIELS